MGARFLRLLVRCTPADFRREYGAEMCAVAEEHWDAVSEGASLRRALSFWMRESIAVVRAALRLRRRDHVKTGGVTMEGFAQDLKHAARGLVRKPGFTAVTVLTLGLGIGAATAIFSAVNTVLLRPLPYSDADRVAVLFRSDLQSGEREDGVSAANMRDLRDNSTLLDAVAVADPWSMDLQVDGRAESVRTWSVSEGFFDAVGAEPLLGRTFTEGDYDEAGVAQIVVVGHRSWLNRFGGDPDIIGRTLTFDGQALDVVGVMRSDFRFPDEAEMWIPRQYQPWDDQSRPAAYLTGVARLADGVSLAQAQAEVGQIATTLREAYPRVNAALAYEMVPLREHLLGDVRTALWLMVGAVGFLLLIACANVAGLMLARGAQRERDYALRGALGAGTGRLVSHVSAESLLLALAGAAFGVVLTFGGVEMIQMLGPDHLPRIDELGVDPSVLGFAVLIAGLSAVVSGFAPSLRMSRPDLRWALGDGSRGSTGGQGQARARGRLVVTQVAAAVVLLVGAGLLIRSFDVLLNKELGFDPENRLALQLFAYNYESNGAARAFVEDARTNILALPGVTGVSLTSNLPGANDGSISSIDINVPLLIVDRDPVPVGQEPMVMLINIAPGYFDVIGTPVVAGRDFDNTDNADGTRVAIVNETFARRHFGSAEAIGEQVVVTLNQASPPLEIVGVVKDTRPLGHASEPRPEIYLPLDQAWNGSLTFVVRTSADAAALTLPVMEAVWEANPAQSVWGAAPVESLLSQWLQERRFTLFLLTSFSVIALVLAAIGLYGLVSFSVERRVGELGIRRALGGRSGDLLGLVFREGARLAGTGLAIGLVAAWYLSRFIQGMLFEVEPTDPLTFGLLGMLVLGIAMLATLVPAMRAVRIDPADALRSE